MRIVSLLVLAFLLPAFANAAVVINEIAWMGTSVSANAEWMELYNNGNTAVDLTNWHLVAGNGSPSITLAGSLSANGYFLLERTSDASVPTVAANQIYTGALTNSGTTLTLTNVAGSVVDQVDGGANWANVGGDNASKETAQRTNSGWETAAPTPGAVNVGVSSSSSGSTTSTTNTATSSNTTTNTAVTSSSNGAPPEYVPIPILRIITGGDRTVSTGADTAFTALVYDSKGNRRDDALVSWSFGDGMQRTGASVYHSFYESGEYIVVVHVSTPDGGDALAESVITAKAANIRIASVSARGISILNNSPRILDLSLWRLSMGEKEFKIPADTQILSGRTILFPSQVIELPIAETASLLYPSGEIAATYPSVTQPSSGTVSYEKVQAVEQINNNVSTNIQTHEIQAVRAPTVAVEPAAVGAASPLVSQKSGGLFASPWTLGLLGVIAFAGGAFILL